MYGEEGHVGDEVRIPGSELRRYLPGELNRLTTRCNTPIQGAGAAVLKVALADLWPYLRQAGEDTVKLAAVVHDEVVLLVREGQEEHWAKLLSEVMETAEAKWLGDIPPLAEAAWGKTWADAK
jgi:DNA polymerase I-like protein with 3'-5' exonuclease and polymerase domains